MKKKFAFMHIPKTGGTTVTDFFIHNLGKRRCIAHLEIFEGFHNPWVGRYFFNSQYIAAHLPFPHFIRQLNALDNWLLSTVIRNPLDQLFSHIMHIKNDAESSPEMQVIAEKLQKLNCANSFSKFFCNMNFTERGLFDNQQTRYLVGYDGSVKLNDQIFTEALKNLSYFDCVGVTENLGEFFVNLAVLSPDLNRWYYSGQKHNESGELCEWKTNKQIIEVVQPFIRYDNRLFQKVIGRSSLSQGNTLRFEQQQLHCESLLETSI